MIPLVPEDIQLVTICLYNFLRVIQSSHPVCNTIMLFGVIICLISVILLGIDGRFVSPEEYPKVKTNFKYLIILKL